jgi:hypothetical protein
MFQSKTHIIDDSGDRIIRKSSVPLPSDQVKETVENLEKTIELAKYIEVKKCNIRNDFIISC